MKHFYVNRFPPGVHVLVVNGRREGGGGNIGHLYCVYLGQVTSRSAGFGERGLMMRAEVTETKHWGDSGLCV